MGLAWRSVAGLAIAPIQDLLNLGNEARTNVPGRADRNWRWRCTDDLLSERVLAWLQNSDKDLGSLGECDRQT